MKTSQTRLPAGDVEIAVTSVGEGTPLVVIHGGPGIGPGYLRPLDAWADEYHVVYYDQRGSGETPLGDASKVTFEGAIDDLDAVRAALGIERVNLVGHSFGGLIAAMYASRRPGTTGSIILLNAAPPFVPELQNQLWANMGASRTPEDEAEKASIDGSGGFASRDPKTLERYYVNMYLPFFSDRRNAKKVDMGFTEITAANVLEAWDRMLGSLEPLDPLGSLARIDCPTLIVHSELDPVPEDFARLLADKISGAQYAFLEGVNHFVHLEEPKVLARAVKPFLHKHAV